MNLHDIGESFRKNELELWCPIIRIKKKSDADLVEFSGSGLIRQNNNRQLEFILIENRAPDFRENFKRLCFPDYKIGKLIPSNEYYSLQAVDLAGMNWTADRLLIKHSFGPAGSIAFGNISILENEDIVELANDTLNIEIFENLSLPFLEVTTKTLSIGSDEIVYHDRNMITLCSRQISITITGENNRLTISAKAEKGKLPKNIEMRLIEALQYISSQTMSWAILIKSQNNKRVFCLRSHDKIIGKPNLSLPINYLLAPEYESVWLLFIKYLEHVAEFEGDNPFKMHSISGWLHFVRNASSGSIFSKGLALGVAVEGILKSEYGDLREPTDEFLMALEEANAYINSFDSDDNPIKSNVKARVISAIQAMKKNRAVDRLHDLQKEGIIRMINLEAWKAIRNPSAHASPYDETETQTWIDNCFKTEVLINHLIFHIIGYSGVFTDYGGVNHPTGIFPLS